MTLTDDEKREIQESDPRGREVLARTEAIPPEQFRKMHGVIRTLRTIDERRAMNEWDEQVWNPDGTTGEEAIRQLEQVRVGGTDLKPGDRVQLWPRGGGDILDLALRGREATVESIQQDYEDRDPCRCHGERRSGGRSGHAPLARPPLLLLAR